jgi:hypothetical protein
MHCFTVLSFVLKYLATAEYMIKIHTDNPQEVSLHMEITLRAGYWIKFYVVDRSDMPL